MSAKIYELLNNPVSKKNISSLSLLVNEKYNDASFLDLFEDKIRTTYSN